MIFKLCQLRGSLLSMDKGNPAQQEKNGCSGTPKKWKTLRLATNGSIPNFSIGSVFICTEITDYIYCSLIQTAVEFEYIIDQNIVPSALIIRSNTFLD